MRLDPGLLLILAGNAVALAGALSGRFVEEAIFASVPMNLVGALLLRRSVAASSAPAAVAEAAPAPRVQVGVVNSVAASAPTQIGQPAGGGGLVDEEVIGTETSSHHFIPDYRAQPMPGFATIYQHGTWLNNKPVTKNALSNCDVVAFGTTKMLVTLEA